jgi:ABC-type phosphate transport system substrate-binding protein
MGILDILKILKSASKALDYLHEKGIFHCNLKPENILLEKNGDEENPRPFISDYGVAQIIETTDAVNASGSVLLGSLGYLAPEVLEGGKLSPAADVYSLGVIIYEAIEGKTPFDAKSLPALIKQKLEGNVPIPENLLKSGGIRAVRVLLKALNVKPGKRQSSASELVSQIENAIKNRSFTDREAFIKPWISSHKLLSGFKKAPYAPWASMVVLFLVSWGIYSSFYTRHTPALIATSTNTPTATRTSTTPPTVTPSTTPIPLPTSTPTFVLSDQCTLAEAHSSQDYPVPGHLLLSEVYEQEFNKEHVSNDMYAIAYYNNRKILEGYSKYHVIDPIGLDVKKDWTIFIPSQDWIDAYKQFPSTIPFPIPEDSQAEFEISGSSVLSRLSAQISKCSAETIKTKLVQINSGTTDSGLQDLCQSKADLFGANKEIDPKLSCVDLEKFEVARYAMVIFIHKNNPIVDDIQKNPLTNEELANLLTGASSWENIREYWENDKLITRYYLPLESGEFEIVQDGIFPNRLVFDPGQLNIYHDGQSLIDAATKDVNAVGIVDYASYQRCENKKQLIAIPVNGIYAGSAIANQDPRYPLMTTLYLYAGKHDYETNEVLRNFINYYLSHELDFLNDLGYLYPSKKGYTGNRGTVP